MDRGDTGFIIHESFKDLKTRRAEQEAYRKALEEQIMQKRKLQEKKRETFDDRGAHSEASSHAPQRTRVVQLNPSPPIEPPQAFDDSSKTLASFWPPQSTPSHGTSRTTFKDRILSFNENEIYNEPQTVTAENVGEQFSNDKIPTSSGVPEFSPECMKYLQQVLPGFTLPLLPKAPIEYNDSKNQNSIIVDETVHGTLVTNGQYDGTRYFSVHDPNNHAFSSGTTSESSSVEDVQAKMKVNKIHVSQTSEQLEGVKVSRKQYREELQKQIDERKRREEELRRKAEEEEQRIQEKIRLDQEKMQREYEEELRKQEEREKEAEKKRIAALAKQKEALKIQEESKIRSVTGGHCVEQDRSFRLMANPSLSEDSIQSIGEFFDETMMSPATKYVDPDDRIIPVVAKRLREKSFHNENLREDSGQGFSNEKMLTARIDSAFPVVQKMTDPQDQEPPRPEPGLIRKMAIRSAPCPPTTNSTDLEFLSTLRNYLQSEKSKLDERMLAKLSKSTEKF